MHFLIGFGNLLEWAMEETVNNLICWLICIGWTFLIFVFIISVEMKYTKQRIRKLEEERWNSPVEKRLQDQIDRQQKEICNLKYKSDK